MIQAISHVLRFEFQRTLNPARVMIWLALCLFPVLMVGALRLRSDSIAVTSTIQDEFGNETIETRGGIPDRGMVITSYVMVPQIACMLGLLVWVTPAVGAELEAQTWIHLVMRPHGRVAVAIGKYLVAFLWTASFAVGSSIFIGILSGVEDPFELTFALAVISVLAAMSYAALYLLIGAVFYKRASIVAVIYSLALEGLVSFIPATINQASVSFRLRTLMSNWTSFREGWEDNEYTALIFGTEAPWLTIMILIGYSATLLATACFVIRTREYPVQVEA